MNSGNKMEIVFHDKIKNIDIINTIQGIVTDITHESLTVMLQNGKFIIISINYLLEINETKEYDQIN